MTEMPESITYSAIEGMNEKKARIDKGFYIGRIADIKLRANKNGEPILKEYQGGDKCKQIILLFEVFTREKGGNIGEPVEVAIGDDGNVMKHLQLANVLNMETTKANGEVRSCFTPKSRPTRTFTMMGWKPDPTKPLVFKDYLGKLVELTIDDSEREEKNAQGVVTGKYKYSVIKDVGQYEGTKTLSSTSNKEATAKAVANRNVHVEEEIKHEDLPKPKSEKEKVLEKRKEMLVEMFAEGNLTKAGLDMAIEQINKEIKQARMNP